jgi:hypothetical protein
MTIQLTRSLLEIALASISPSIDTVWENTQYTPSVDKEYQETHLLLADPQNPTFSNPITSPFTRENGIYQVTLKYPQGVGPNAAYLRAQLIRNTFFQGASFTSGLTTLIISRTPTIAPGRNDGDRWSVPVKIPFFANIFGT